MKSDDGANEWCDWCGEDIEVGKDVPRRGDEAFCSVECMKINDAASGNVVSVDVASEEETQSREVDSV